MKGFTFEEMNLMAIYNFSGTREGLIAALTKMRSYLETDETELMELTDSAVGRLKQLDDEAFAQLELVPEFGE